MVKGLLVENNFVERHLDDSTKKPIVCLQAVLAKWLHTFWAKETPISINRSTGD